MSNEKWTLGMRGQVLLTKFSQLDWGRKRGGETNEKKKEKKRRKERGRDLRERESNLSLDFPVIDSENSGEARSKVGPHCKSYAWAPDLWSFDNSER